MKVTGPNHDLAVDRLIVSPKNVFYNDAKAESSIYVIVDGENRWKSAKDLGWNSIPCEVRNIGEEIAKALCYRRNRERGSLDPLKEALLFKSEVDLALTQESIARKYNVSRQHVAHRLALIKLDEKVVRMFRDPRKSFEETQVRKFEESREEWKKFQENPEYGYMSEPEPPSEEEFVPRGTLTASHLEAIVTLSPEKQVELAETVLERDDTVRETESRVKRIKEEIAREKRFKEALKKAKRPKCPYCTRKISDIAKLSKGFAEPKDFYFGREDLFRCSECGTSWDYMKTREEAEAENAGRKTEANKELTERLKDARENPRYIRLRETPEELHENVKLWILRKVLELTEVSSVQVYGKRGNDKLEINYDPPKSGFQHMSLTFEVGGQRFSFNIQPKQYKKVDAKSRVDMGFSMKPSEETREALHRFFAEIVKTDKDPWG